MPRDLPASVLLDIAALVCLLIALPLLGIGARWGEHHRLAKWVGVVGIFFAGAFFTGVLAGFLAWMKE